MKLIQLLNAFGSRLNAFGALLIAFGAFPPASPALAKPAKEIRFEEELVEGLNRRPLDSFHQVSEELTGRRPRLYRKRSGFQDRNEILFQEMRMKP